MLRLAKTNESNAAHTLDLTIIMRGTDIAPATWTIEAASVPFWLSLPLTGAIGARDAAQPLADLSPYGNLSLTANTSGLPERLATPYEASLKLSVASQRDASFSVNVILYVSAPTIARTSVWGRPTDARVCQQPSDDEPIEAVVGEPSGVPFTACDVDGLAVDHEDADGFEAVLVDRRKLSRALLAKELGAQEKKSRALYRLSSAGARSSRGDASTTAVQEQNV